MHRESICFRISLEFSNQYCYKEFIIEYKLMKIHLKFRKLEEEEREGGRGRGLGVDLWKFEDKFI